MNTTLLDYVRDGYWCLSKQQDQCISSSKEEKNREHMEPAPRAYVFQKYDCKMKDCNVMKQGGSRAKNRSYERIKRHSCL